jgi:hypothetical protein
MLKRKQLEYTSPSQYFEVVDHFIGTNISSGALNIGVSASGGTATAGAGGINAPGVARASTGTGATGSINLRTPINAFLPPASTGLHNYHCRFRYRLPADAVSATDPANWVMGFGNANTAAEPTNGAFLYIDGIDGGQYFIARNANGRTAIAHDVQPTNAWLECHISLLRDNTARFTIQNQESSSSFSTYFIADNKVPTLQALGMQFGVWKTAGSAARFLDLDWISFGLDTFPSTP